MTDESDLRRQGAGRWVVLGLMSLIIFANYYLYDSFSTLKEIIGLPVVEVGRVMDIPAATVKTRLFRARLKVRRALESTLPLTLLRLREAIVDEAKERGESVAPSRDRRRDAGIVRERPWQTVKIPVRDYQSER